MTRDTAAGGVDEATVCALLWELARSHGWSSETPVGSVATDANVLDERRARDVARTTLADMAFVGYHRGRDTLWLDPPPTADLAYYLRDTCGFTELQIEATLASYFDGF